MFQPDSVPSVQNKVDENMIYQGRGERTPTEHHRDELEHFRGTAVKCFCGRSLQPCISWKTLLEEGIGVIITALGV